MFEHITTVEEVQEWAALPHSQIYSTFNPETLIEHVRFCVEQKKNIAILYHADCADGLVAAALMYQFITGYGVNDNSHWLMTGGGWPRINVPVPMLIPVKYNEEPPQLVDVGLAVIVDFSYKYNQLTQMGQSVDHIYVLDHHITAVEHLMWSHASLPGSRPHHLMLCLDPKNETYSGAGLAAKLVTEGGFADGNLMRLAELAQDYDLWRHDGDPQTPPAYLNFLLKEMMKNSLPPEHLVRRVIDLQHVDVNHLLRMGKLLVDPVVERIQSKLPNTTLMGLKSLDRMEGRTVPVCAMEHRDASLAAYFLKKRFPHSLFSVTYDVKSHERIEYSLRQIDPEFDVSAVAAHFGGGGHQQAAGFVTDKKPMHVFD